MTKLATKSVAKPTAAKATFTGKTASLRNVALSGVASLAYAEAKSRTDIIAQLRIVAGPKPTDGALLAMRAEYIAGRAAQRFVAADVPDKDMTVADRITFARKVLLSYAAPAKDGVKSTLRKGQTGRRSVTQHKVIRAAEEAWSQVKTEMGFGAAKPQKVKNKEKRAPQMAGAAVGQGVTHSELVKPDGAMTTKDACNYLESMAATMLAFCNKHAGVVPTDYGMSVKRFHGAMAKVAKDRAELKEAIAEA